MVAFVLANPGAIGYVPAGTDTGKARVVGIKASAGGRPDGEGSMVAMCF